jgi:NAD-dependent deacetylase
MDPQLESVLNEMRQRQALVVALTGAGISAESGIPTFRGPEGYWTVGSRNYMPQEMATAEMFELAPDEVWRWYLYRFWNARSAQPNPGHLALAALERALGDRFALVTQNIDGLHRRAGSSFERTYCIHGEATLVRCARGCTRELFALPVHKRPKPNAPLSVEERGALSCPYCGDWLRPHVLWFDEYYEEEYYRSDSALRLASQAELLLVVGTSGATTLPMRIAQYAYTRGAVLVDVDPEPNPFSEMALESPRGFFVRGSAAEQVPPIARALGASV